MRSKNASCLANYLARTENADVNASKTDFKSRTLLRGRHEVYFFVNDPVIFVKILIPDPGSDGNFDP